MAGTSLLALLDDIATVLDDISLMTGTAARKTAGVLGDDLALNAQQVAGVRAERELPVVWAVAKGSAVNKAILVPAALVISVVAPWAVLPLLMIGGAYLCYEGFEKLAHRWLRTAEDDAVERTQRAQAVADPAVDLVAFERDKIKGAIRTDFILSAEIIVISLGTVAASPFVTQLGVLVGIAIIMTVGVYGLVAAFVKMDDAGLWLSRRDARLAKLVGRGLLRTAPVFMRALGVIGTIAMFMVGGGILVHGMAPLEHAIEGLASNLSAIPGGAGLASLLMSAGVGVVAGGAVVAIVYGLSKAIPKR